MSNNKIKTTIFFIIMALVVSGAIVYFSHPETFLSEEDGQTWRTKEETNVAKIIQVGDITACEGITYKSVDNIDYKVVCRNNIAMVKAEATLDISWCSKLDNVLFPEKICEEMVISGKLSQGGGLDFCAGLNETETKEYCENSYWSLEALKKDDVSVCKNISGDTKQLCEDNVLINRLASGELLDCGNFSLASRFNCESFYAAASKTDSVERYLMCNDLSSGLRRACLEFKR